MCHSVCLYVRSFVYLNFEIVAHIKMCLALRHEEPKLLVTKILFVLPDLASNPALFPKPIFEADIVSLSYFIMEFDCFVFS